MRTGSLRQQPSQSPRSPSRGAFGVVSPLLGGRKRRGGRGRPAPARRAVYLNYTGRVRRGRRRGGGRVRPAPGRRDVYTNYTGRVSVTRSVYPCETRKGG